MCAAIWSQAPRASQACGQHSFRAQLSVILRASFAEVVESAWTMAASAIRLCSVLLAAVGAQATSMHLASLCRGHSCAEMHHPILDYDKDEQKCICRAHPCWDDDGQVHSCETEEFPHLRFSYDNMGTLSCGCSSVPHYESVYIAKDMCAGHYCEEEDYPILDYNPDQGSCICRAHPCMDIDGMNCV